MSQSAAQRCGARRSAREGAPYLSCTPASGSPRCPLSPPPPKNKYPIPPLTHTHLLRGPHAATPPTHPPTLSHQPTHLLRGLNADPQDAIGPNHRPHLPSREPCVGGGWGGGGGGLGGGSGVRATPPWQWDDQQQGEGGGGEKKWQSPPQLAGRPGPHARHLDKRGGCSGRQHRNCPTPRLRGGGMAAWHAHQGITGAWGRMEAAEGRRASAACLRPLPAPRPRGH